MGVKQKTPTPFVGAGSVRTLTPNLLGLGGSIANGANAILDKRFQERKRIAEEEGNTAGSNFITYDKDGNLENLKPLPKGDTYYEQALRDSAKVTYLAALRTDIENFGNKYLTENPYEPEIIKEKMNILSDNYLSEMDEDLIGDAQLIINSGSKTIINKAYSNKIIKHKEDTIANANIELENIASSVLTNAEMTNAPLEDVTLNLIRGLLKSKQNSGEKVITDKYINDVINDFKDQHEMSNHLYGYNKILHMYDPEDKANNYKIEKSLNEYKTLIRDSLKNNDLKSQWDNLTEGRYNNHITELNILQKKKEDANAFIELENYEKITNDIVTKSAIDKNYLYIAPENRKSFIDNLTNQVGKLKANEIWRSFYQGHNVLRDTQQADNFFRPIWRDIKLGKEGYKNWNEVYLMYPDAFDNPFTGAKNTDLVKKYFLDEYIKELDDSKNNQLADIQFMITDSWIHVDSSHYHYSLDATEVRKNLINFVKESQKSITDKDERIDHSKINTIMNAWSAVKTNILKQINYGDEVLYNLNNNISLDDMDNSKAREWALENIFNDSSVNPAYLNADQVLMQANQIRTHRSTSGVYTSYLKGALSFDPEALENTMPYLNRIFANPDNISIDVIRRLKKAGVPVDYLQAYHQARKSQLGIDEARKYATANSTVENTQRLNTNFYKSIAGKVWGIGNDTDVKDDMSLRQHIQNIFEERSYANSGLLDARMMAPWNDHRFRPNSVMMNKFKDATGYDWDEVLHALPPQFYDNVISRAKIVYSLNPSLYQNDPTIMDDVIENQIALELDFWHPNVEIAAGGDFDDKPYLTWSKHSLLADAESLGGWGHTSFSLTNEVASADIGMKLSLAEIPLPERIPAERQNIIGRQIDDERHATSWLDVDFTVQYERKDPNTGENLYGIYYYDEYNRKIQLMSDNEDGTKSPVYYDYTYTNSSIYAAEELAYKESKGDESISGVQEIWNTIKNEGLDSLGGKRKLKTHKDVQRFRLLIPDAFGKFFDGGQTELNFKNMLKEQRNKDNRIKQREWLNNTVGSFLEAGANGLSADRINNLGLSQPNLLRAQ